MKAQVLYDAEDGRSCTMNSEVERLTRIKNHYLEQASFAMTDYRNNRDAAPGYAAECYEEAQGLYRDADVIQEQIDAVQGEGSEYTGEDKNGRTSKEAKMKRAIVVLNEQHSLMSDQERVLNERFESYEILPVPARGWTLEEIKEQVQRLATASEVVVFASPVPAMIVLLASERHTTQGLCVFHNDHRDKKELPNGKTIMTVAKDGWQLV